METQIEFPDDIVVEILMKLPAKAVFKCKSVSKNWLSLISDASFNSHFVLRPPPLMFIFQIQCFKETISFVCNDKHLSKMSSPFPTAPIAGMKIASTANDLILFESDYDHFVANPFTRRCVCLPMRRGRRSTNSPKAGLMTYLDEKGAVTSYIVVRIIMRDYDNRNTLIEIFSSEKGECRWLEPPRDFNLDAVKFDCWRPCVVYKGALHWLCNRMSDIFVYDPAAHECRLIETPNEVYHVKGMNTVVGTACGKLFYFEANGICLEVDKRFPNWKMWVMGDYGKGEWRLHGRGGEREMEGIVGDLLSTHSPVHPIAMHPCKEDVVVYFWHEGYILTFDTKTGWFDDKFSMFSPAAVISSWEIHPLFMPLCSTRIPTSRSPLK